MHFCIRKLRVEEKSHIMLKLASQCFFFKFVFLQMGSKDKIQLESYRLDMPKIDTHLLKSSGDKAVIILEPLRGSIGFQDQAALYISDY